MTYYESPVVTDWQKQIIMGTILGGSSLVKPTKGRNCYLFMRSRNKDWLMYKSHELKIFSSQRPFTEEGNTLRWHSNCYPIFNEFRDLFYKNNKKILDMSVLDQLRDIGLAVWFGDCGRVKKNTIHLNTHKFGEEESNIIVKYFNEVGIESKFLKERGNCRVAFTKEGSEKFLSTIGDCLPQFMYKKLF